jgi:hypothetical protein
MYYTKTSDHLFVSMFYNKNSILTSTFLLKIKPQIIIFQKIINFFCELSTVANNL